jgi:hypothetical protein
MNVLNKINKEMSKVLLDSIKRPHCTNKIFKSKRKKNEKHLCLCLLKHTILKTKIYYISFERIRTKVIIAKVHVKRSYLATSSEHTLMMVVNISSPQLLLSQKC